LAGELADIVHLASFFGNVGHHRDNLAQVRTGAQRSGRAWGSFEIDISLPCSISSDREAARKAARRPAAIGILWTSAQDEYALEGWRRPPQFRVPAEVVAALSTWNFRRQPQLPDELDALISDDILDEYALAGTADECAQRLVEIQRQLPEVTGLRIYAVPPLPDGKLLYDGYVEMLADMERMIALVRATPVALS